MSGDLSFILFVFLPLIILGLIMVIFQQKFFNRYEKIFPNSEIISNRNAIRNYKNNPSKTIYSFIKIASSGGTIYSMKHTDSLLNRYALIIKLTFVGMLLTIIVGICAVYFVNR